MMDKTNRNALFGFNITPLAPVVNVEQFQELFSAAAGKTDGRDNDNDNNNESDVDDNDGIKILRLKKRNKCFVLSNMFKHGSRQLLGYRHDVENIDATFRSLNFDVDVKKDLTYKQSKEEFEPLKATNFSSHECLMVFILSHGLQNGKIICNDNKEISLEYLIDCINDCASLNGKPKLIFIQTCRGDVEDEAVKAHETTTKTEEKRGIGLGFASYVDIYDEGKNLINVMKGKKKCNEDKRCALAARNANTMIYYSTHEGMASWVSGSTGSIFIQSVCKVFKSYGGKYPLTNLITRINDTVCHTVWKENNAEYVEACEVTHSLTCDIYFSTEITPSLFGVTSYSVYEETAPVQNDGKSNVAWQPVHLDYESTWKEPANLRITPNQKSSFEKSSDQKTKLEKSCDQKSKLEITSDPAKPTGQGIVAAKNSCVTDTIVSTISEIPGRPPHKWYLFIIVYLLIAMFVYILERIIPAYYLDLFFVQFSTFRDLILIYSTYWLTSKLFK